MRLSGSWLRRSAPNISVEPVIKQLDPVRDEISGRIYEFYLFHLRWLGGEIRLNDEHTGYAWVNRHDYKNYPVMRGVDIDLLYLDIWPEGIHNRGLNSIRTGL